MKKYKIEILQTDAYVIDVLAENKKEAERKAIKKWNKVYSNGTSHYYQQGNTEIKAGTIYDVSDTDDPFNP